MPDSPVRDVPTLTVGTPGSEHRICFQGLPIGYEFAVLLDAVERISSNDPGLWPEHIEQLSALPEVTELMVFVTPNCSYCPAASAMANRMALADSKVRSIVVEANEFPELLNQFGVQGVPQTVVNRSSIFVGALPPAAYIERVLQLVGIDSELPS
jgi:glutaredoxin-like protein